MRQLGTSDLFVSEVGFGCWPMAGITSIVDSQSDLTRAIHAAVDAGVNFFDTAYSYGYAGESDQLLREALQGKRQAVVIASKVGMHWNEKRERVLDARPAVLIKHAAEILQRLDVEYVDIMYLHAPDGTTPIEEAASGIAEIVRRGWARYAAVSNVDCDQAAAFHRECPVIAVQPYFNMLSAISRRPVTTLVPRKQRRPGLLLGVDERSPGGPFAPSPSIRSARPAIGLRYFSGPVMGQEPGPRRPTGSHRHRCWLYDLPTGHRLDVGSTQITVALCGAKRPSQIIENAQAMALHLDAATLSRVDACIAERGQLS